MTRNSEIHQEISTSTGEIWTETRRNSIGGWSNMVSRIEERMGGRMSPVGDSGETWTVGDVTVTITRVWKV